MSSSSVCLLPFLNFTHKSIPKMKPHRMCISVWTVQHGLVYRVCKEDGHWAQKNTSECEDDPGEVCVYSAVCFLCVYIY